MPATLAKTRARAGGRSQRNRPRERAGTLPRKWYALFMSTSRITISVPEEVALRMREAAGDGSLSAWVTGAIEARLDDAEAERLWRAFYESVAPTRADVRRADALFQRLTGTPRRKRAA